MMRSHLFLIIGNRLFKDLGIFNLGYLIDGFYKLIVGVLPKVLCVPMSHFDWSIFLKLLTNPAMIVTAICTWGT